MVKVKYPTKFKKEAKRLVVKYTGIAKLDYVLDIIYLNDDKDGKLADILIQEDYHDAEIRFYPCSLKEWKKNPFDLEQTISHEIAHILTEPIYNLIHQTYKSKEETERAREQTTEKIARIMQCVKR